MYLLENAIYIQRVLLETHNLFARTLFERAVWKCFQANEKDQGSFTIEARTTCKDKTLHELREVHAKLDETLAKITCIVHL